MAQAQLSGVAVQQTCWGAGAHKQGARVQLGRRAPHHPPASRRRRTRLRPPSAAPMMDAIVVRPKDREYGYTRSTPPSLACSSACGHSHGNGAAPATQAPGIACAALGAAEAIIPWIHVRFCCGACLQGLDLLPQLLHFVGAHCSDGAACRKHYPYTNTACVGFLVAPAALRPAARMQSIPARAAGDPFGGDLACSSHGLAAERNKDKFDSENPSDVPAAVAASVVTRAGDKGLERRTERSNCLRRSNSRNMNVHYGGKHSCAPVYARSR